MKVLPSSIRWRLGLFLAAAVAAWLVHGLVLRGLAEVLVAGQPAAEADYLVLRGGDRGPNGNHAYDEAARFYHAAPARHIVLLPRTPGRLVELGVLPSFATLSRQELGRRGVPAAAITVVDGQAIDAWEEARLLAAWLQARPKAAVVVANSQFDSGHFHYILDSVLSREDAARCGIIALHAGNYDTTNWWCSRSGVKDFMFSWLELIYTRCQGENCLLPPRQSASDYQASLRKEFARQKE